MVMDANFVITKMPILACWASSHRGKNVLTDQKIKIFKVHDIDTIIQPREKTHQTHVSSVLKHFMITWGVYEIVAKFQNFTPPSPF